jgi:hypothetical protein
MKSFNTIDTKEGTEGPRHDPYSYTEVTVNGRNGRVTYHYGLDEWVCVGEEKSRDKPREVFERLTGVDPWTAEKISRALPYRKHQRKCGKHFQTFRASGYPCETFAICCNCGDVVDCNFNIAAVE